MKTFQYSILLICMLLVYNVKAQELAIMDAKPVVVNTTEKENTSSPFLFDEYYTGSVTGKGGQVVDGVSYRFNTVANNLEFKHADSLFISGSEVTGFTLPTGTALYYFQRGFPAVGPLTNQTFYQVVYDGNVKLLKHFSPSKTDKPILENGALFILKDKKLNPVSLANRNSFLKLLSDERNKMNYIIKESQLDFDKDEDLAILMQEYDAYKAGRGGN